MKTGVYHFKGIRTTPSKKFIVSIDSFVEVRVSLLYPELMVAEFGKAKLYPISNYEGEWELIHADQ